MKLTKHLALIILCGFVSLMMWADGGELYTSGKLSSSLINCITQDKYGFIWVGTEYGLSRFDGYRFTNYLHNEKDTTSITDNIISSFLVDKKGNLWIGCAKGLMRYNYETNDFTRLKFPDGRKPRIYSLVESHNGDILMGTAGFGLYSLRKDSKRIVHERQYAERETDVFFTHIYEDQHHYFWQSSHLSTFLASSKAKVRWLARTSSRLAVPLSLSSNIVHKPCSSSVCMAFSTMTIRRAR